MVCRRCSRGGRVSDVASSNELPAGTDAALPVTEVRSLPPPERSTGSSAAQGCVSAAEPSDRSPGAGAGASTAEDAAGPETAAGPAPPLQLPAASVAAAAGTEVFKFSANGDTTEMRPVFDKSRNSRAVGSSSTAWTLPPCQVTVRPTDRGQFWDEVKAKVEGLSAGAGPAVPEVQPVPSRVPASDPVGSTGQDKAGAAASSEGLQAFPVLQGATHNTYQPLAWQALTELRDAVGKYGLSSAEVMQVLRYFNASLLTPFDIRSLARALFPLVEYDFFENKWTQLAVRAVERNRTLGQDDPRRMVNIDMLMGTGNYTRAEGQAGYEPLVQEQCQQAGMAALVQTLQLATPQQPFATIIQGIDEPFLCFAGRLTPAVEKQVSDPAARKLMIQSLAQGNCNAACKRIIETLPGEPSMSDMVGACAKVSPSIQQVVAVPTAVQPAVATIVQPTWLVDRPIWENQWPLPHDKLVTLRELVQEQLDQGHLEPSTSPWNTPVFCIKKKSGKWRLLQDLRKINAVMEGMGTLQAGMPLPTMLPADCPVLIVDLKDCFFTIPLHPDDRPKFAFTVPTINNAEPAQRYQWRVLPQGMRNSPMLRQWYVARALSGVRKRFPDAHVYHYMDDILVATPTQEELLRLQPQLLNALHSHGLQVAPEKVQQQPPWKYLGVKILERTIRHQEVQFVQSVKTLNDAQKLVGVITWLRPYLGLTTAQLSPLFELLKGDTDLKSPRELTPEARKVLEEVQQAVSACQVYRIEPSIDVTVFITTPDLHPTGIIGQWNDDWTDPLHVLEWVFLPHQPHKTVTALFELIARLIIKCRQRCLQLMGADPSKIILPVQREEFDWSYANNVVLQSALEGFSGQITYHLPSHKLLQVAKNTQFSLRPKNSQESVQGPTIFTDGSGKTGKAIVTWQDGSEWQVLEGHEDGSAQLVELKAAVMAFEKFSQEPFNLITDSAYVADIAQQLGCSVLKEVSNPALFNLLKALWCAIQARVHPYYVLHVRSHTNLPAFVAEGNARADKLANPAWVAPQPDVLVQAKASHGFFHQNAHALQKQFQLTATEAREIVESCDDCHALGAPLPAGVNPRGLKALELWQTDVTQVAEFGRLKHVHVTVDTFSSAMWASAHTGEKARDVIAHWRQAFAILGIPSAVKTDNGPAYALQQVWQFLQSWGVSHNFGIPHSPTGQAIVERNHSTLKRVLQKQKRGMQGETPHSRLAKALYTINHLTVPQNSNNPVILNHHLLLQASDGEQQPRAKVRVRNLVTKQWEGPYDLIAMGRGYACVSTDTGTRWLPSKCVHPDLRPQRQNSADRQGGSRDQLENHQVDESSSDHSDDSSTDSD
ncbi:hypothetical protein DUI87_19195 [Hirundo rustica rustica]|uniref:Uncharacterized protein n=1 Tax=Hirundo rustica rustica TaxID=333673 RepID=A0A3M0JZ01_HIRRU|nr:hypothetical protein DUI87_19195 [Hirundo rustica rustica]